ncbi:MAG: extracellular solute-binding protein [Christensenellaceae bacterium]|nr:extracellular solute-binding protein [Christensenellaceae bacterium]
MKNLMAVLLVLVLSLSSCLVLAESAPVTVRVRIGWQESSLPNWVERVAEFEKENPDIDVELEFGVPDMTKLQAEFMSGDAPDVVQTWKYAFNEFVDAGLALELSDMYEANGWNDELYDGVRQWCAPLSECTQEECSVYGVADFINTSVIYYNTKMFEQYGLTEPTTLEELIAVSHKLKENGVSPMVYVGGKSNMVDLFAKIICQTTPMSTILAVSKGEKTLLDEGFVKASEIFQQMYEGGVIDPKFLTYDDDQAYSAFANGEAAMYSMHTAYNVQLEAAMRENPDFDYAIMKGIKFADDPIIEYSATYGGIWMIPASCKNAEQAMRVLSFLYGMDMATEAAAKYGRIATFPKANEASTSDKIAVVINEQLGKCGIDSFYFIDMVPSAVLTAIFEGMQEMVMGNVTAEEMLAHGQETLESVLDA